MKPTKYTIAWAIMGAACIFPELIRAPGEAMVGNFGEIAMLIFLAMSPVVMVLDFLVNKPRS